MIHARDTRQDKTTAREERELAQQLRRDTREREEGEKDGSQARGERRGRGSYRPTNRPMTRRNTRQTRRKIGDKREKGCSAYPHFPGAGLRSVTVTDAPQTARNSKQCNVLRPAARTAVYHDLGARKPGAPPQTPVPGLDCSYASQFSLFRFGTSFSGPFSSPLLVCPFPALSSPLGIPVLSTWRLVSSLRRIIASGLYRPLVRRSLP